MNIKIVRITQENYNKFDDMVCWRIKGKEKGEKTSSEETFLSEENKKNLQNKNLYVFALEKDSKYIGWISLIYMPKIGLWKNGILFIDELWVSPEYRNNGFAQILMDKAKELKKELKAIKIRLYVDTNNKSAINLYEKNGLKKFGETFFMQE
jgi:ribosomal protein S18 acetylase RimI-like enzyme